MSNISIETLLKQRGEILDQKAKIIEQFDKDLNDINAAIETLSGKTVWLAIRDYIYDDENPNYIKASAEEL